MINKKKVLISLIFFLTYYGLANANDEIDNEQLCTKVKKNTIRNEGIYTIHHATSYGCLHDIEYFLEQSVSINAENQYGYTPLIIAVQTGTLETVHFLLTKGAKPNYKPNNKYHKTALFFIGGSQSVDKARILYKYGANLFIKDDLGGTPLLHAIIRDNYNLVKYFIEHGLDVNGDAKLRPILFTRSLNVFNLLIAYNANPYIKSTEGDTVIFTAAQYGEYELLKHLIASGHEVNHVNQNGWTPLMAAVVGNRIEHVKLLVESGAALNSRDDEGKTALVYAKSTVFTPNKEIIDYLVSKGAIE